MDERIPRGVTLYCKVLITRAASGKEEAEKKGSESVGNVPIRRMTHNSSKIEKGFLERKRSTHGGRWCDFYLKYTITRLARPPKGLPHHRG